MSIPTALYSKLSSLVSSRVYPIKLPQGVTLPAITYFQVSGVKGYTHDGADGMERQRYQISCWGVSYKVAKELAESVVTSLNGFTGDTVIRVKMSMKENETDMGDPETGWFQVPVDFIFLTEEVGGST